jgi:hypothetical protein
MLRDFGAPTEDSLKKTMALRHDIVVPITTSPALLSRPSTSSIDFSVRAATTSSGLMARAI